MVRLLNTEPISIFAADARRAETGALVDSRHVKFGKTVNLPRRLRDYEKTFGVSNIQFRCVQVNLTQIGDFERMLKDIFNEYRLVWKNRRLEWLYGVDADVVWAEVQRILKNLSDGDDAACIS